jgi:uncharacterized protein (DUF2252 family)
MTVPPPPLRPAAPVRPPPRVMPHLTVQERIARGKAARAEVPRSSHAGWAAPDHRRDPVALLEEQAQTRVPELVPIRHGRMLSSPFGFFRGAAYIMAADLAATPSSGLWVQLCGDAHLSNFGGFGSPERTLLFDVNDFDETLPGPWEWDVKRLAASLEVAGRARNFSARERRAAVMSGVREYRQAMRSFAAMSNLDVWYSRLDTAGLIERFTVSLQPKQIARVKRNIAAAHLRDNTAAVAKLTRVVDGQLRIVNDPPLVMTVDELFPQVERDQLEEWVRAVLRDYRSTLQGDRRRFLEKFKYMHLARKVVGVGSVGTRCWIVLLVGRNDQDPLLLQCKEAEASVLEPFVGRSQFPNHGQRVVEGQRMMQAASDIFLGWIRVIAPDEVKRDFYVRQLWDWKISTNIDTILPIGLAAHGAACGWTLARGHARSGDPVAIASYLGAAAVFDNAVADFAAGYADQSEADFRTLGEAVKAGQIKAEMGV